MPKAAPVPTPIPAPAASLALACRALPMLVASLMLGACVGRPVPPEAPILEAATTVSEVATGARIDALLPTGVLLLGEQHDAPAHQQLEQQTVAHLASRGLLAALVIEMADVGVSTAKLQPSSTDQQARTALKWNEKGWPWANYGPAVMTAVRAGVPVLGANLPRAAMNDAMADAKLDTQLPGPALKAQQQLIRVGHCSLLPESQITPMTRIQIAKDVTMANTLTQAALPGKVVLFLSGSGHANRELGVPQHLPADLQTKSVRLRAGTDTQGEGAKAFDTVWVTPPLPEKDYCAELRKDFGAATRP